MCLKNDIAKIEGVLEIKLTSKNIILVRTQFVVTYYVIEMGETCYACANISFGNY